ncbi:MAG: glycosyltransferase [Desulfovibrio sp.]|jgi:glycosyltransferase involved in cell wall biosynthesis|nr:glycosyltransferase [Desulfovibrio sp.]
MPSLSLCSYTYNDGRLLRGLLEDAANWSRRPDEIIIVDDGSRVPFDAGDQRPLPIPRLIRFPENRGFIAAKSTCINAASGDIILAADCDARMHPDFARVCMNLLERKEIGLVSGEYSDASGTDLLSRYNSIFNSARVEKSGPVEFICGLAFAIRRELWNEINGFGDGPSRIGEDWALCNALKERGYQLFVDKSVPLRQVRRLTRHAHCRRLFIWMGDIPLRKYSEDHSLPEQFVAHIVNPMLERTALIGRIGDPALVYFELLYVSYMALKICGMLGAHGRIPALAGEDFMRETEKRLAPFPLLLRLLKSDLLRLEVLPPKKGVEPKKEGRLARERDWNEAFFFADIFSGNGVFDWLNREGARRILLEDEELDPDFSVYADKTSAIFA